MDDSGIAVEKEHPLSSMVTPCVGVADDLEYPGQIKATGKVCHTFYG